MTIPRTLRKYIEAGRLEEVESSWLARLEEAPEDVDFFVVAARALKGAGEDDAARTLLELLDDEWHRRGLHELRLTLLRKVGPLLHEADPLHEAILATLALIYGGFPSFEGLVEHGGLHRAVSDIPKTWLKVDHLRELLQFETGSIVWMKGKGAGRVTEVNLELANFKVDFERSPGLRVGFKGAAKLMVALPSDHILRRKIENPQELLALKRKDPDELLLATLRSYEEGRSATQIREALAGIVSEREWTSWWSSARKNPQVLVEGKGARQTYSATASSEAAEAAVGAAFGAADNEGKLEIFRRNAARNAELRDALARRLVEIAERSSGAQIELRFAIAHAVRDLDAFDPTAPWAPEQIVASAPDPAGVLGAIGERALRERAQQLVRDLRGDWPEVFVARLAQEEDPKLLDLLANELRDADDPRLIEFYDRVLSHPRKHAAAFVWMAERAASDDELVARKPMRFLQTLLASTHATELELFKSRFKKLLEDGGPSARLIQYVEPEQAANVEELLKRSPLEDYLRQPLINSLHMRFPELRPEESAPLYALPRSIQARKAELKKLREIEIPANRRAIEEARELGDLRENFEYKSARQRHEYLAARQAALQLDLARAKPIDLARGVGNEVRVAAKVELRRGDGTGQQLVILGPWESDPDSNIISYDSDLARALLGERVGSEVEFGGDRHQIVAIEAWSSDES